MSDWAVILGIVAIWIVVFRWQARRWRRIRERERLISVFMKYGGLSKEQIDKVLNDH